MDIQEAFDAGFDAVKEYVDKSFAAFEKRILALESKKPEPFPDIEAKVLDVVEKRVLVMNSDDVKEMIAEAIAAIPVPKDGVDGKDGRDGVDGKDGSNGIDGKDGADGIHGKDGIDGINGKDGLDAREFLRNSEGHLVVTMSDGSTKDLGPINGKDGAPGRDGKDGFSLKNFDAELKDDSRTLLLKFADDNQDFAVELPMHTMIYRQVYRAGESYKQGDTVTWGGDLWHCDTDTSDKPDGEQRCWTLCVRRGRDGKK